MNCNGAGVAGPFGHNRNPCCVIVFNKKPANGSFVHPLEDDLKRCTHEEMPASLIQDVKKIKSCVLASAIEGTL